MLCQSFVPSDFCFDKIMPLLKEKHGHTSMLGMYTGMTLSCTALKLFEYVIWKAFWINYVSATNLL